MTALARIGSTCKRPVLHTPAMGGIPVCGGGHGARGVQWQLDIGPPNCKRCAAILERRQAAHRTLLLTLAYLITQSKGTP